jgi:hypothetical protein
MTNSHIAEVLASCAIRFNDEELKTAAVELIKKYIQMMFFENEHGEKDVNRPNCFEHYHPFHGRACLYRGVDDYQHSWVVDLIIKYVVGVQIEESGELVFNPLDFGLTSFELANLQVRGKKYVIRFDEKTGHEISEI